MREIIEHRPTAWQSLWSCAARHIGRPKNLGICLQSFLLVLVAVMRIAVLFGLGIAVTASVVEQLVG